MNEANRAVGLRGNVHHNRCSGILSEKVFIVAESAVSEIPAHTTDNSYENDHFSSAELETLKYFVTSVQASFPRWMQREKVSFGTPLFEASVPLSGAWTSSRMSNNCPAKKSVWSGGKIHPRVGHVPSRWEVCAETRPALMRPTR